MVGLLDSNLHDICLIANSVIGLNSGYEVLGQFLSHFGLDLFQCLLEYGFRNLQHISLNIFEKLLLKDFVIDDVRHFLSPEKVVFTGLSPEFPITSAIDIPKTYRKVSSFS